jgi:DNA repair protein RadC
LSDLELVALVLGSGTKGVGAIELANNVLESVGGLAGLARAEVEHLEHIHGIGPSKACALVASFQLAARSKLPNRPFVVSGVGELAMVARPFLDDARRERAVVVICDVAHQVRHVRIAGEGSTTHVDVHPRDVLATVLRLDGVAFGLAHGHPSGDTAPSVQDVEITRRVANASAVVGVRFLGHVVLGGSSWSEVVWR